MVIAAALHDRILMAVSGWSSLDFSIPVRMLTVGNNVI